MKNNMILVVLALLATQLFAQDYTNYNELKELVESGSDAYLLLDVRTPEEFAAGHIPGAVNIPYDTLPKALPEGTEKDETIILYCRSGNRSGVAARALRSAGYSNLHDFGGLHRWKGTIER